MSAIVLIRWNYLYSIEEINEIFFRYRKVSCSDFADILKSIGVYFSIDSKYIKDDEFIPLYRKYVEGNPVDMSFVKMFKSIEVGV